MFVISPERCTFWEPDPRSVRLRVVYWLYRVRYRDVLITNHNRESADALDPQSSEAAIVGSDRHFCRECVKMTLGAPRAASSCVAAPEPILTIPGCPDVSVSSAARLRSVCRCSDGPVNVV